MLIDSSSAEIKSKDLLNREILPYLQKEGLIGDYRTHTAKEEQGL